MRSSSAVVLSLCVDQVAPVFSDKQSTISPLVRETSASVPSGHERVVVVVVVYLMI